MAEGIEAVFDFAEIDRAIANLEALGRDATPLMREVGLELVQGARRRLGGQTGPTGAPWPALLPAYQRLREAMYPGVPSDSMLKVSGMLSRSLTFRAGPTSVQVGSPLIYAGVHQTGFVIRSKGKPLAFALMGESGHAFLERVSSVTIPARPYLGIGQGERLGIEMAYQRAMRRALEV